MIVLDGSNSIYPWSSIVDFLDRFLGKIEIGPKLSQVSCIIERIFKKKNSCLKRVRVCRVKHKVAECSINERKLLVILMDIE